MRSSIRITLQPWSSVAFAPSFWGCVRTGTVHHLLQPCHALRAAVRQTGVSVMSTRKWKVYYVDVTACVCLGYPMDKMAQGHAVEAHSGYARPLTR